MKCFLCILALVGTAMSDSNLPLDVILKTSSDVFGANMLHEVAKSQKDMSFVLSAFSVLSPLAQLALASVGETHDEILKTIDFPDDDIVKLVFSDFNTRMHSVNGIDLEMANKLYVGKQYVLNDQFAATEKKIFNSDIENIDFNNNTKAAAEINTWVEDHTHKRIKDLVDPSSIDAGTSAVLVNAIYFKGTWKKQFDKYWTNNGTFHVTKDLSSTQPMMHQTDFFNYASNAEFDAKFLEMEYKGEGSLIVALPNKIEGINSLIEKFKDPSSLNKVIKSMDYNKVSVSLPKFKIKTTTNLVEVLTEMNIKKLFEPGKAQLYNLLKEEKDLYVSGAVQKTFIDLNENGVEAAAANEFGINLDMDEEDNMIVQEFNADRPFMFFIMDRSNVLFSGVYRS